MTQAHQQGPHPVSFPCHMSQLQQPQTIHDIQLCHGNGFKCLPCCLTTSTYFSASTVAPQPQLQYSLTQKSRLADMSKPQDLTLSSKSNEEALLELHIMGLSSPSTDSSYLSPVARDSASLFPARDLYPYADQVFQLA